MERKLNLKLKMQACKWRKNKCQKYSIECLNEILKSQKFSKNKYRFKRVVSKNDCEHHTNEKSVLLVSK